MSDTRIERLNYFNGQRLEAADFKAEQSYHLGVRRWLNRSLFSPGIAAGLKVEVKPGDAHTVIISPGLALDELGREIIVVEPIEFPVSGRPTKVGDPVTGNYLVIEYAEAPGARVEDGCAVRLGVVVRALEDLSWGDPSRIFADPKLSWQHRWPNPGDAKIVLAQIDLDETCAVREVRTFVRKFVGAAKSTAAQSYALEGEKDMNLENPKELYFRVEGGAPTTAVLILRGLPFSTLYYSELGGHTHQVTVDIAEVAQNFAHTHTLKDGATDNPGDHVHGLNMDEENDGVDNDSTGTTSMKPIQPAGNHTHKIVALHLESALGEQKHKHAATGTAAKAGATNRDARAGAMLKFLSDVKIFFDSVDVTSQVLAQLNDRDGPGVWTKLGDGTAAHKFSAADGSGKIEGTGEIDLLRMGVNLSPGAHRLTFGLAPGNASGGKIQYNLYIG